MLATRSKSESIVIRARITRIRWRKPDGARCIVEAQSTEGKEKYTIVGDIDEPAVGQEYEFDGDLTYNHQYHSQEIKLACYRTILPTSTLGIERYLVETAQWVGRATAVAMTHEFGNDTLAVIKADPERVAGRIRGITIERAREMQANLLANEARELAAVEVGQILGASMPASVIRKAVKEWGDKAAIKINRNPYVLCQLPRVGFRTADALYRRLALPLDGTKRLVAATLHALDEAHRETGNTTFRIMEIEAATKNLIGQEPGSRALRICSKLGLVDLEDDQIRLATINQAEHSIEVSIRRLLSVERPERPMNVPLDGLAGDQVQAVEGFKQSPVFILTGAPGTGKTYTIARMVSALTGWKVQFAAPTGKAAKQMTNALAATCGGTATTIHKLLGPNLDEETGEFTFTHNSTNQLQGDLFVIDEASMIDVDLGSKILAAIPSNARLLIVGDKHQLPSVGPGSVLRDMITAGVPSFELTEIKRNAGCIVKACHAIKDGKQPQPAVKVNLADGLNWRHVETSDAVETKDIIESLYRFKIPQLDIADIQREVQMIAPHNEAGSLSCKAMNDMLREIINPHGVLDEKCKFRIGDKVVRLRNGKVRGFELIDGQVPRESLHADKPEVLVVNGDIGHIESIDEKLLTVRFADPDRRVQLPKTNEAHQLRLAYCMTCHKLQGSEAKIVVIPLDKQMSRSPIWTREWIYTAFSRAKALLITVGQRAVIDSAIARVGNTRRRTMLTDYLSL